MPFPNRYVAREGGFFVDKIPATASVGVPTSGQIVATNTAGKIDSSFIVGGSGSGSGFVGVTVRNTSYTAQDGDRATLVAFSSPATYYIPSGGINPGWYVFTENIGATGNLIVQPVSGAQIDNLTSPITIQPNQGIFLAYSGANLFYTERGMGTPASGDILYSGGLSYVVGFDGIPLIAPSGSIIDGIVWEYVAASGAYLPVFDRGTRPTSAVQGKPPAGLPVLIYTAEATQTYPANFHSPDAVGSCGTNPAATAVYSVYKNGVTVGTITVSTSGIFTFATTGGVGFTLNKGDRLVVIAPSPQDTAMADVGFTLVGTRGNVSANTFTPQQLNWRGAYNNSSTYQPYDMVSYNGSSYICIAASTGNLPTNTSFWNLIASAGSNGTLTPADQQNLTYDYVVAGGAANTYTATPSTAYTGPTDGQLIFVKIPAGLTNTGASTLNVSGLGAKNIKTISSLGFADPAAGAIAASGIYAFEYNSSAPSGCWQMQSGSGSGGGASSALYLSPLTQPPAASNFTWVNQGTSVTHDQSNRMVVEVPDSFNSVIGRGLKYNTALPSTPYTIDIAGMISSTNSGSNGTMLGAAVFDGSNNMVSFSLFVSTPTTVAVWRGLWSSAGAPSASSNKPINSYGNSLFFLRITDDGTNRKFYYSQNGLDYWLYASEATNTGVTPTNAGIQFYNNGGGAGAVSIVTIYHFKISTSVLPQFAS